MLLKDPRIDPSDLDSYTIIQASREGHKEVVEILLKDPREFGSLDPNDKPLKRLVNPSADHNWAIIQASNNGHKEIVEMLLKDSRVNSLDCDNAAAKYAVNNRHEEVLELLLDQVKVNPFSYGTLTFSIYLWYINRKMKRLINFTTGYISSIFHQKK